MGKHDEHLPDRRHLNKAVNPVNPVNGVVASKKSLVEMARGQGSGTKADAKNAKARKR